jgi:hypothetical protein
MLFKTITFAALIAALQASATPHRDDAQGRTRFDAAVDRFVHHRDSQRVELPFLMERADTHKNAEAKLKRKRPLSALERRLYAMTFEAPDARVDELMEVYGGRLGRKFESFTGPAALTNAPQQIHIAVTAQTGNVSVMWATANSSTGSQACWWPEGNTAAKACAGGDSWTYDPISLEPWHGRIHGAYMTSLQAGSQVSYQVGDPTLNEFSTPITFTVPDLEKKEIFVALGGDMGTVQLEGWSVADRMYADFANKTLPYQFDAFWLLGDIAYSTVDPPHDNFEFFWDMYFQQEQPLVSKVPFMVTYGNHDISGGDSGAFINRFRNPKGHGGNGNFYWAYEHGPVKFISMCTEWSINAAICQYGEGTEQRAWLERELANVDRTRTPWLIVGGHRPMYSSDKSTDSGPLRADLEALFNRYGVNVGMWGHMHCSEVVAPVYNMTTNLTGVTETATNQWTMASPTSTVHLTTGTLGAVIKEKFLDPSPEWSLFRAGDFWDPKYGYTTMHATATQLEFTTWTVKTTDPLWKVTITK